MSKYTKIVANTPEDERSKVPKSLKTSIHKHTGFGNIEDSSLSLPIDPSKSAGYSAEVIALAGQLKYQHEKDNTSGVPKFNDEFYLQYAKRQLDGMFDSSFDKVLGDVDCAPDPAYAQYSYEEIIAMANNGVNIPKSVLAWAKAQQEADVVDYVVISDNIDYTDENSVSGEDGESEINKIRLEVKDNALKAKKTQEDISKNKEKTAELTNQASEIVKEQKNIFRGNSIDDTEKMVNEWKELDKKKNEGKLSSSEKAKYKNLSGKLQKNGEIIQDMKKKSLVLDNFLESIDNLNEEANEGMITAQKTINSASALTNLDDRLNTFIRVHAYKIADRSSGMLEDVLSNLSDTQLAYVSDKIGHDLEDLGDETFLQINDDETKEVVEFADDYINKSRHIEYVLGLKAENDSESEPEVEESEPIELEPTVEPEVEESEPIEQEPTVEPEVEEPEPIEQEPTVEPEVEESEPIEQEPTVEPEVEEPEPIEQEPTVEPEVEESEPIEQEPTVEPEVEEPEPIEQEPTVEPEVEEPEPIEQEPTVEPEVEEPEPIEQEPIVVPTEEQTEGFVFGAVSNPNMGVNVPARAGTRTMVNLNDNPEQIDNINNDVNGTEPTVMPTEETENILEDNSEEPFSEETSQISEEPEITDNEPTTAPAEDEEPFKDAGSDEDIITSEGDIRDYVKGAVTMGKQPQDIIYSLSDAEKITVVSPPSESTGSSNTEAEETNGTSENQNGQKQEKINDPLAELKSAYGSNQDFVALAALGSIAALVGLGPAVFTFEIIKSAAIVGLSVLDLFEKDGVVNQGKELSEKDVSLSNDAVKALMTKSDEIKAQHDKNSAQAKALADDFSVLNDNSVNVQFEMMQNQALLVEAGKISPDEVLEFADPNEAEKNAIRTKVSALTAKDAKLLATIGEPTAKSEKSMKISEKSIVGFEDLNDKLTERTENNDNVGDFVIATSIAAQGYITAVIATLLACGPWCWSLVGLWAAALVENAAFAAVGVGAKLASDKVEDNIDENTQSINNSSKITAENLKQMADVRKAMAKVSADKINNLPAQEESETQQSDIQNPSQGQSTNNNQGADNSDNEQNDTFNETISFVRKESDTRSGFDQSSLNAELDINNPNDVKKANEYAIEYTRDVNDADEKSKAAASTNANVSTQSDTTKADVKLSRFNRDGAINSTKRSKKVNAASASHNGRKRR